MAGLTRRAGAAAMLLAAAMGLASCGGGTNADALKTCQGVRLAAADVHRAQRAPSSAARRADLLDAQRQMANVVADAAMANSEDGSFDALMTLVQESQEMGFPNVEPALTYACKAIDSPTSYL
ncbi:MAG TPA: hypothetical protein VGZ33_03260 [Acidimicrobiales bacterium]|nr:hypothetical protein [Acidimicrobiales bacterium]